MAVTEAGTRATPRPAPTNPSTVGLIYDYRTASTIGNLSQQGIEKGTCVTRRKARRKAAREDAAKKKAAAKATEAEEPATADAAVDPAEADQPDLSETPHN